MARRVVGGAASSTPPLDRLLSLGITPFAWFSPFRGRASYTGAAMRVRRSSDNAEQDIGFVAGRLDTGALLAFCGAGDGLVTTIYEQVGGTAHAVQAVAGSQPAIVTAGVLETLGGQPAMRFVQANNPRLISTLTPPTGALAVAGSFNVASTSAARAFWSSPNGTNGRTQITTLGDISMGDLVVLNVPVAVDTPSVAAAAWSGGNTTGRLNGTAYGPAAVVRTTPASGFFLGARTDATGTSMNGLLGDVVIVDGVTDLAVLARVIGSLRGLTG
jgi:hypothetical protein